MKPETAPRIVERREEAQPFEVVHVVVRKKDVELSIRLVRRVAQVGIERAQAATAIDDHPVLGA